MKNFFLLTLTTLVLCATYQSFAQTNILIISGGHDFEKQSFFKIFDSYSNVRYDTLVQPLGNKIIENSGVDGYDVLVFYDMYQEITEPQKSAYINMLKDGKGMVFLHHSLVSYQNWPEFQKIIGGKYIQTPSGNQSESTYKHDVDINVEIVDRKQAITKGMKDFVIHDEVYGNYVVNENVTPILKTKHPDSSEIIGWNHQYEKSRIVYLQLGHDHHAYENENYRLLILNAIMWVKPAKKH